MADMIRVASRSPMRIRMTESADGKAPGTELKYADLAGSAATPGSLEGVTEVDADLFHSWMKANEGHPAVVAGLIREMGKDETVGDPANFGFEPALEAATSGENADAAAKGSTTTEPGAVSSVDMKATSDTPADDSPRSQTKLTDTSAPVVTVPAAQPAPAPAPAVAPAAPTLVAPAPATAAVKK